VYYGSRTTDLQQDLFVQLIAVILNPFLACSSASKHDAMLTRTCSFKLTKQYEKWENVCILRQPVSFFIRIVFVYCLLINNAAYNIVPYHLVGRNI
jgi:hypothetical protein